MVLPDHPTPIRLRTHTITPVPFMIYSSLSDNCGVECFDEDSCNATGRYIPNGYTLMNILTEK